MCHSPSGAETEIDMLLARHFSNAGLPVTTDACGNMIATVKGRGEGTLAITAHKDEIGAVVTDIAEEGRIKVRNIGGSFPWIYGEGPVDILGDKQIVTGILSFGSRHVGHGAPQLAFAETAPLKWADVWIETHQSANDLIEAGVRPGSKIVIGKHRKRPLRLGDHIASYALDNKASLAVLMQLAINLKDPACDVLLVATSKEEVGAVGGLYFTQHNKVDALIALEVMPVAEQYSIKCGADPVVLAEDGVFCYDDVLLAALRSTAENSSITLQLASVSGFGSDASIAMRQGHLARGACLGFPTQNTHGFEIANLESISNCISILEAYCQSSSNVVQ
jgi:putative aminopeptidase FrvX